MEQPNGHPCPECGAPRHPDNTPSCTCTDRASEALRDARTAEAAAAEDFDPLRIRPYVEIDAEEPSGPGAQTPDGDEGARQQRAPANAPAAHVSHPENGAQPPSQDERTTPPGAGPTRPAEPAPQPSPATPSPTEPPARPDSAPSHSYRHSHSHSHANAPVAPPRTGSPQPEHPTRDAAIDATARRPLPDLAGTARAEDSGRAAEGVNAPATVPRTGSPHPERPTTHATEGTPRRTRADAPDPPAPAQTPRPGSTHRPSSPAEATLPLRPVGTDADATAVLPAVPGTTATSVIPTPLAPGTAEPDVTDLRLFDGAGPDRRAEDPGESGRRPGRRRRTVLLAAVAACVAVVTAAGYASGLFSYESPSRDTAVPDDIRASVPDAPSSNAASTPPATSASAAPPAPAAPPPSPSRTGSPSPSPSAPSASPSPSRSAGPSAPPASATATAPGHAPPDDRQNDGPAVLRRGDRGPQVTELQLRLRQLYLYNDDADGSFDDRLEEAVRTYQWSRGIQTDDLGVYDRQTRARLESETKEP